MVSFNQVVLAGNLTRDPELRYTPGGAAVCEFTIAVNRTWTNKQTGQKQEEVSFIDCVAWSRTAEVVSQYVKKGNPILVSGRLQQDRWEDSSGQKRSKIKVTVVSMQLLGGKRAQDPEPAPWDAGGTGQAADDDVPF